MVTVRLMAYLNNEFVTLMTDVVYIICPCSWFDGCFTGLFGPSLTLLTRTTGRMCRHGKTLVVRGNLIAECQAKELWDGSTRAIHVCFCFRGLPPQEPQEPCPVCTLETTPLCCPFRTWEQKMNSSVCWMWNLNPWFIGCIVWFAWF